MCVTDRHMTLAVKVALNPNTTNQPILYFFVFLRLLRRNMNQIRGGNIHQILLILLFL